MRVLRVLFSLLAVAFGVVVAGLLMLVGLLSLLVGGKRSARGRVDRPAPGSPPRSPHAGGDVIDIEATPVKD